MPIREKTKRNKRIYNEYKRGRKGYKKLSQDWGLHYTTIAKIVWRMEAREKAAVR